MLYIQNTWQEFFKNNHQSTVPNSMKLYLISLRVLKCPKVMLWKNAMTCMKTLNNLELSKFKINSVYQLTNWTRSLFFKTFCLCNKPDNHFLPKKPKEETATTKWKNGAKNKKEWIKKVSRPFRIFKNIWNKSRRKQNNCLQCKLGGRERGQERL